MKAQHLAEDRHQNISNPTKEYRRNDLAMIFDGIALMCKQNHLPIPSRFGVRGKGGTEVMENRMKTLMIVDLCQSLSFLVRWETQMETQNESANLSRRDVRDDGDNEDDVCCDDVCRTRMIIDLSKVIMEFLDTENALSLSPEELDRMVLGCLLDTYRIPSIVNDFETDTVAFYDWWRKRIKSSIGDPYSKNQQSGGCYQRLGWRHLAAMIRETRDQLRPPPLFIVVNGAGSKEVNGEYKLVGDYSLPVANGGLQRQEQQQEPCYRFYGNRKVAYEKTTKDGRTFSLCLCGVNQSPTSQGGTGHSLWFLTELDEEQPNTDCDIDYYCALPRNGNCKRTNPVPPLQEWKRCSHGLFPSPKLALSDAEGAGSDIHWQRLARWILEEDLLAECCWWCTHKQRDKDADSGFSSVMEFLMEIYEELGRSNLGDTAGSSLGTELLVKFAASCLAETTN